MKAINKTQVIDLMNNINRDGVDNTQYSIDIFVSSHKPEEWHNNNTRGYRDYRSKEVISKSFSEIAVLCMG